MNRARTIVALAGAVALLALGTACFETTVSDEFGDDPRSVSVSGTGEVRAEPDIATLSLGVEARADTVASARAGAATAMAALIASLRDGDVDEADIRTLRFSIQAIYDRSRNYEYYELRPVVGYAVSNTVTVTVRNIDATGELIDAATAAAGDAARFNGLSFGFEDPAALVIAARELAVEDARAKAEQLAELTGVTLGDPLTISDTSWTAPRVETFGSEDADVAFGPAETSISPGTSGISVTVNVVWAIR